MKETVPEYWRKHPPKYKIGDKLRWTVKTTDPKTKLTFNNDFECYIGAIRASSGENDYHYEYGITLKLPQPYDAGSPYFEWITEKQADKCLIGEI